MIDPPPGLVGVRKTSPPGPLSIHGEGVFNGETKTLSSPGACDRALHARKLAAMTGWLNVLTPPWGEVLPNPIPTPPRGTAVSFAEKNAAQAKAIMARVGPHMEALAVIADRVNQKDTAKKVREQIAGLTSDTFNLIILGRFRNGKSTFLNAMLCELTHPVPGLGGLGGPMPVSYNPTTAVLTAIAYGETPSVSVRKAGGRTEEWSLEKYLDESKIKRDPEENERFFKDIEQFEAKFPSKTLQSGITMWDGPGTDDISERTEIVTAASNKCDSAIVLLRSDSLGGQDERKFIQSLYDCELKDLFFVVNRRDGRAVDDDMKQEAWNRIAHMVQGGPKWTGQDPATRHIYFVDAKAALDARLSGDHAKLVDSGMVEFEGRLLDFLEREKRAIHLERFVSGVNRHAQRIDETIAKLIPGLKVQADDFMRRYQQLQPELEALKKKVDEVPRIAGRYRDLAAADLEASLRKVVNDLIRDLPDELAAKKIEAVDDAFWSRPFIGMLKKKVYQQTADAAKSICDARFDAWKDAPSPRPGAQQVMDRVVERMVEEISEQVRDIKSRYDRVQVQLTGLSPAELGQTGGPGGEWGKRVLAGAFSLISPDYGISFMNEGMKGLGKSVLLHFGVGALVGFLGGPIGWAIAAAVAAGMIRTAIFAPDQIKKQVAKEVTDGLLNGAPATKDKPAQPGLRELADQLAPKLREKVGEFFDTLETGLRQAVAIEVEAEEATIREQLANASKGAEEKQLILTTLGEFRQHIANSRAGLEQAIELVRQGRA